MSVFTKSINLKTQTKPQDKCYTGLGLRVCGQAVLEFTNFLNQYIKQNTLCTQSHEIRVSTNGWGRWNALFKSFCLIQIGNINYVNTIASKIHYDFPYYQHHMRNSQIHSKSFWLLQFWLSQEIECFFIKALCNTSTMVAFLFFWLVTSISLHIFIKF